MKTWSVIVPLAVALLLAGDLATARRSCANHDCETNCCMLPCLAKQLVDAQEALKAYRELARNSALTKDAFDAKENEIRTQQAVRHAELIERSPQCDYKLPDLKTLRPDRPEVRELMLAGITWKLRDDGRESWNLTVETNMATCEMQRRKIAKLRDVSACPEMADTIEKHEQVHVKQCEQRRGRRASPESPQLRAQDETEAWRTNIKELTSLLRGVTTWCEKSICKSQDLREAAKRIAADLPALKKAKKGGR